MVCILPFGAVWLELGSMAWGEESTLFVGTYTGGTDSRGIYAYRFDDVTGALKQIAVTDGVENPSFLMVHPTGKWLYSSDEIDQFDGEKAGAVSAFAIAPENGTLTLLNQQAAGGTSPCHLTVDPAGRHVLVVDYGSGTVAVLPLDEAGRLKPADAHRARRIERRSGAANVAAPASDRARSEWKFCADSGFWARQNRPVSIR